MSKVAKDFTAIWVAPGGAVVRFSCRTREQLQNHLNRLLRLEQETVRLGVNELWNGRVLELSIYPLIVVPGDFEVSSLGAES